MGKAQRSHSLKAPFLSLKSEALFRLSCTCFSLKVLRGKHDLRRRHQNPQQNLYGLPASVILFFSLKSEKQVKLRLKIGLAIFTPVGIRILSGEV